MLILYVLNDGSGDERTANYRVEIAITATPVTLRGLARARIEGHRRGDGWRALVRRIADEATDDTALGTMAELDEAARDVIVAAMRLDDDLWADAAIRRGQPHAAPLVIALRTAVQRYRAVARRGRE